MNSGSSDANASCLAVARTMAIHSAAMKPGYMHKEDVDQKSIDETTEEATANA